ncbi:hypothetical protein L6452_03456 [Arctium lappa]|uniref:Uncharacterized protein n=1 Tax=Arctium lappa TaxID=4217 RepID=A0ACB9FLX6_ARCLA|nr:hypothetical protein L6452_03456 [Arctium lappa]
MVLVWWFDTILWFVVLATVYLKVQSNMSGLMNKKLELLDMERPMDIFEEPRDIFDALTGSPIYFEDIKATLISSPELVDDLQP